MRYEFPGSITGRTSPFVVVLLLGLWIGGCATVANVLGDSPSPATETAIVHSFTTACEAYRVALQSAAAARHFLTVNQVADIDAVRPGVNALCLGPMPTNVAASAVTVVTATATIVAALGSH